MRSINIKMSGFIGGIVTLCILMMVSCEKKPLKMSTYTVNKAVRFTASDVADSLPTVCRVDMQLVYPSDFSSDSVAEKIKTSILDIVAADTTLSVLTPTAAIDSLVARQISDYRIEYREARKTQAKMSRDGEDVPMIIFHESVMRLKSEVVCNDDNVVAFEFSNEIYDGGAHGMTYSVLVAYDAKTGDRLELRDIFDEGYEPLVSDMIKKQIMFDRGFTNEEQMLTSGFFNIQDLEPTPNFLVKQDSISFMYNPYDIAAYALGKIKVTMPLDKMKNVLKKDSKLVNSIVSKK